MQRQGGVEGCKIGRHAKRCSAGHADSRAGRTARCRRNAARSGSTVDRKAVQRHPALHAHADRADLRLAAPLSQRPDADPARRAERRRCRARRAPRSPSLRARGRSSRTSRPRLVEVEHEIADPLARPVIGVAPAAPGRDAPESADRSARPDRRWCRRCRPADVRAATPVRAPRPRRPRRRAPPSRPARRHRGSGRRRRAIRCRRGIGHRRRNCARRARDLQAIGKREALAANARGATADWGMRDAMVKMGNGLGSHDRVPQRAHRRDRCRSRCSAMFAAARSCATRSIALGDAGRSALAAARSQLVALAIADAVGAARDHRAGDRSGDRRGARRGVGRRRGCCRRSASSLVLLRSSLLAAAADPIVLIASGFDRHGRDRASGAMPTLPRRRRRRSSRSTRSCCCWSLICGRRAAGRCSTR